MPQSSNENFKLGHYRKSYCAVRPADAPQVQSRVNLDTCRACCGQKRKGIECSEFLYAAVRSRSANNSARISWIRSVQASCSARSLGEWRFFSRYCRLCSAISAISRRSSFTRFDRFPLSMPTSGLRERVDSRRSLMKRDDGRIRPLTEARGRQSCKGAISVATISALRQELGFSYAIRVAPQTTKSRVDDASVKNTPE
jgi:hypothetical protein